MNETTLRTVAHRSSHHLKLLAELERSRRSLQAARSEVALAALYTSSLAERMNEREEFAHAILDGIDVGIVTADPSGMVTFVNRTAKNLLSVPRECSARVSDLLALEADPDALLGEESTLVFTYPLSTPDGEELDLELSISRASSTAHAQIGFFFIFSDTREKKMRTLERERLERLAAMGTMVAGFAHEVRNPVAALRSLAESLAEELSDAQIALPHVTRMLKMVERIERLVRTSLQFGRPTAPRRERCRPHTIVAAAISSLTPRTLGSGDEIRVEFEPNLPDVFVDETQLVQVLVILLNNALDSVGSPRRVLVSVREGRSVIRQKREPERERSSRESQIPMARPAVRFEVHDDGVGIPPDILGQIFDPFFTTKPAGTGLGLSIAQQIVSENGGAIEVTSQHGGSGGTTFSVVVPVG
jgi:two-component system sensor histidine kinase HydH